MTPATRGRLLGLLPTPGLALLGLTLSLALPVAAEEHEADTGGEDRYTRAGGYFQLGGRAAFENFGGGLSPEETSGIDVRVGYRLLPVLAGEIQVEWLEDFDEPQIVNVSTDVFTVMANARGYLPLGRLQPFALLGMGLLRSEVKASTGDKEHDGFAVRFGAGVDFHITRYLALSVDASYVLPAGGVADFDYTSVGGALLVRF